MRVQVDGQCVRDQPHKHHGENLPGAHPSEPAAPILDRSLGQLPGPLFMKIARPTATWTPPSAAAVTVTSAGSGCAADSSRISELARVAPLLKFLPGRAAESLAAGWVRKRHRITVIDATGAPQNRSSMDWRECGVSGRGALLVVV